MQARMLRQEEITHPALKSQADVIELRRKLDAQEISPQEWRAGMFCTVAAGTVIDHPHAHQLVMMGMAEPHDKECADRCKRLNLNVTLLAEAQDRVRNAQLTGDPAFDRDDTTETDDDSDATEETDAEPKIVIANDVLAVPIPAAAAE